MFFKRIQNIFFTLIKDMNTEFKKKLVVQFTYMLCILINFRDNFLISDSSKAGVQFAYASFGLKLP